jgi:FAD binding domain
MGVSQAIEALKQAFPSEQIILRGTGEFEALNSSYLSALESDITPACIFRPKTTEEVSRFIQTIKPFTTNGETAFAIRGGGQQPMPGCANIEDGITLDLGLLTGIKVKDGIVSIAAGERWGAVYEKLGGEGLGVNGGRSGRGGIGGLALQGMSNALELYNNTNPCRWPFLLLHSRGFRVRQCRKLRSRSRIW